MNISFKEYFDIVKLGYYCNSRNLVLVFKIPVVLPHTYDLYKLSVVPNRDDKVLFPSYPLLAIHDKDFMYIEAECPKSSQYYLCEDSINQHYNSQGDCIHRLTSTQQVDISRQFIVAKLKGEDVKALYNRHYVASCPAPTTIWLSCTDTQHSTTRKLHHHTSLPSTIGSNTGHHVCITKIHETTLTGNNT